MTAPIPPQVQNIPQQTTQTPAQPPRGTQQTIQPNNTGRFLVAAGLGVIIGGSLIGAYCSNRYPNSKAGIACEAPSTYTLEGTVTGTAPYDVSNNSTFGGRAAQIIYVDVNGERRALIKERATPLNAGDSISSLVQSWAPGTTDSAGVCKAIGSPRVTDQQAVDYIVPKSIPHKSVSNTPDGKKADGITDTVFVYKK